MRKRPPWWMYLVLVPCTAYVLCVWYVHITGPETLGFVTAPGPAGLTVQIVQPGLAADRAGLRAGDIIHFVNGAVPSSGRVFRQYVGKRYELLIERQGQQKGVVITLGRKDRAYWTEVEGLVQLADIPFTALCIGLSWLIALRRPDQATARLGSLVLALWPVYLSFFIHGRPSGLIEFIAAFPLALSLVPLSALCLAAGPFQTLALMFCSSFPGRLLRGRWIWLPVWIPALMAAGHTALLGSRLLYGASMSLPWLRGPVMAFLGATILAVPVVLVWNYRSLDDVNEKRRTRVLVLGIVVSLISTIPDVALAALPSSKPVQQLVYAFWISPFYVLGALLSALGPYSMAYAIVRHRVFDVGVIVRQGLRYAAAKGILLALAPFFGAVLVADLALHSNQTMAQAFAQRGWLYAVLGIAALAAHRMRKSWIIALDRRFYRERYDAQRILRSVLTQVRQAATLEEAAPQTVAQIDAALHPQFAAIMIHPPQVSSFRPVASSGESQIPDIPAESKFVALVRLLGKPLELQHSDTDWLRRQLPAEETGWLKASRIEWIYPVALGANRTEVLLALAPKRSEEPYTQEDQDLLEGITSGLGLLAERVSSFSSAGSAKQEQPTGKVPDIAQRYTMRGELGRGGMGTVYEAHDVELQRGVAIKVMNPELIASQEAVARFKSEARAAAAFSHPNVVTVYDFGFSSDARAYLVMELLSGRTLRQVLRAEGRLELVRTLAVMRGVCSAVESAHRIRLLHRDLKPENIFLARSGGDETPKVLDFGVAKALKTEQDAATQADTAPGQLLGTLAYMSPEQLKGLPPAPSWDLWALAVIGYEMVTGAHPFEGAGLPLHAAVLASRITPVRVHVPDAAEQWDALFTRALAADPVDRPGFASELLAGFEAAAGPRRSSASAVDQT